MLDLMDQEPSYSKFSYSEDAAQITDMVSDWYNKHPRDWNREDVMHWLTLFATTPENQRHYEFLEREFPLERFNEYAGDELLQMHDYQMVSEPRFGTIVIRAIREAARQYTARTTYQSEQISVESPFPDPNLYLDSGEEPFPVIQRADSISSGSSWRDPTYNDHGHASTSLSESDDHDDDGYRSNDSTDVEPVETPKKQGKTTKGPKRIHKTPHLWEFLLDMLREKGETNQPPIRWVDLKKGVFRIENSKAVARDWGIKKNNPNMKYENMARGIRFSRDEGFFAQLPSPGQYPKKKCFCFGKLARDHSSYLRSTMTA